MEKKNSFQNRRQKAIRPVAVKLSQIQDSIQGSRRRMMALIFLPLIIIVALGGLYLLASENRAKSLVSELKANETTIRRDFIAFAATYKKAKSTERPDIIRKQATSLKLLSCGSAYFYNPLQKAVAQCEARNRQLKVLSDKLIVAADIVQYDTKMITVLNRAIAVDADSKSDWKAKETAWRGVITDIQKLVPPPELAKLHNLLKKRLNRVAAAWKLLQEANGAKKLGDFESAKKVLAARYDELREISAQYAAEYGKTQQEIVEAKTAITS